MMCVVMPVVMVVTVAALVFFFVVMSVATLVFFFVVVKIGRASCRDRVVILV